MISLSELKNKAMAAHTQPYKFIQAANPSTILDLIQTVEEMREVLDWVLKADVTKGDLKGDVSKALTKFKEKWGI